MREIYSIHNVSFEPSHYYHYPAKFHSYIFNSFFILGKVFYIVQKLYVIDLFLSFTKFVFTRVFPQNISLSPQTVMRITHRTGIFLSGFFFAKLIPPSVNSIHQFSLVLTINFIRSSDIMHILRLYYSSLKDYIINLFEVNRHDTLRDFFNTLQLFCPVVNPFGFLLWSVSPHTLLQNHFTSIASGCWIVFTLFRTTCLKNVLSLFWKVLFLSVLFGPLSVSFNLPFFAKAF